MDLEEVRQRVVEYYESLAVEDAPYGAFWDRDDPGEQLYASADLVIIRTIMGENLERSLSDTQRRNWAEYIDSFVGQGDDIYPRFHGHSILHANGTVIGGLGPLGGSMQYPTELYEPFDDPEEIPDWLDEEVDWSEQWGASHKFWGGIHCFSMSDRVDDEWLDVVFEWLNQNLDPETGWWRDGVAHSDSYQPLGGAVHIYPIYEHHDRKFPYPGRVIDSVLDMQLDSGNWREDQAPEVSYLNLDALYALRVMREFEPEYRSEEITQAVNQFAGLLESKNVEDVFARPSWDAWGSSVPHPHEILAFIGICGLLQQHEPDRFSDNRDWTDIFTDPELYRTADVQVRDSGESVEGAGSSR